MSIGLFADVHGNLEALLAVKKDMETVGPDKIYFLGDVAGYGPNPIECIEIVKETADVQLQGNHDYVTTLIGINPRLEFFNNLAAEAIEWTRIQLTVHRQQGGADYFEFLKNLKTGYADGKNLMVHGSPNDQINEYIMCRPMKMAITPVQALNLVAEKKKRLFAAHAHHTWVYFEDINLDGGGIWYPAGNDSIELPKDEAAVIMVGSVGQPRDGDWRACWVLVDGNNVSFRRCEYDVDKVVDQIYKITELDDRLGNRLKLGR